MNVRHILPTGVVLSCFYLFMECSMARSKDGVNKTAEINKYLAESPNASPKEVAEALSARGIEISAAYVSTIKSNAKRKTKSAGGAGGGRGRRGRRPAAAAGAPVGGSLIDTLIKAKKLAEELGGVDEARRILDALARLA